MHGFANMPYNIVPAHMTAADLSTANGTVKTVLISAHLMNKGICLHPRCVELSTVDSSAFHLSKFGFLGRPAFLRVCIAITISGT